MSASEQKEPAALSRKAKAWAWAPVGMIGTMLAGLSYMAYLATNDPSFSVEKDYYKKAIAWDDTQAQAAKNAQLGWSLDFSVEPKGGQLLLAVRPKDSHGKPIRDASVEVEAFANARAGQVLSAQMNHEQNGELHAAIPFVRPGVWEFRFVVQAGGERFTQIVRTEVPRGDAS